MDGEFPKVMVHPNHVPAQVQRPSQGKPLREGEQPQEARAALFPPVTVNNADQEQIHMAQGYRSATGPAPDAYVHQEYPKWVGDRIVNSAEEEAALAPPKRRKAK